VEEKSRVILRPVEESDKEFLLETLKLTSDVGEAYNDPKMAENYWERSVLGNKTMRYLMVCLADSNRSVAYCSLQDIDSDVIEIGLNVYPEYQGMGYGAEAVKGLLKITAEEYPGKEVIIRTRSDNAGSVRIAEKCGGRIIRKEKTQYDIIAEKLAKMAEEVGEDTSEILSNRDSLRGIYTVVYRMEKED